jgi:hypothetical protein
MGWFDAALIHPKKVTASFLGYAFGNVVNECRESVE